MKKALIILLLLLLQTTVIADQPTVDMGMQKAMQQAEKQSGGKSLSAKRVNNKGVVGYSVRVLSNGKVSHVFIPSSGK